MRCIRAVCQNSFLALLKKTIFLKVPTIRYSETKDFLVRLIEIKHLFLPVNLKSNFFLILFFNKRSEFCKSEVKVLMPIDSYSCN